MATNAPVEVQRQRVIHASKERILAVLGDPAQLAQVMPRVKSLRVLSQNGNTAQVEATFGFEPFGTFKTQGEVQTGTDDLVFRSQKPAPVESRWVLRSVGTSTEVTASLSVDLRPLLGPLAGFVPRDQVAATIAPDIERALAALAQAAEAR